MDDAAVVLYRKLLQAADTDTLDAVPATSVSITTTAATRDPIFSNYSSAATATRPFNPTSPFDSSMALTILVLLTALFFMGFFSIYIRRFSAIVEEHPSPSPPRAPPLNHRISSGGLDPSAVKSLPVLAYGKAAKHPMIDDCPICLSEFQEGECVKLIPYCGHVFHPKCVDTWLSSHVTCPLCRSAQLFQRAEEVCLDVARFRNDMCATVVGNDSTCRNQRVEDGVRRVCSCSDLENRSGLVRSTSF